MPEELQWFEQELKDKFKLYLPNEGVFGNLIKFKDRKDLRFVNTANKINQEQILEKKIWMEYEQTVYEQEINSIVKIKLHQNKAITK